MAGHGRTSWDDVAVVTVSILRLVARYEKQNGEPASLSRREMAKVVGVSEYRVHAAIRRLVGSGLVNSEARYRDMAVVWRMRFPSPMPARRSWWGLNNPLHAIKRL